MNELELPGLGRRVTLSALAAILLVLITAVPIVLFIPIHQSPAAQLELVGPSNSTSGQIVTSSPEESSEIVIIENTTISSRSFGWESSGYSSTYDPHKNTQEYFEEFQTEQGTEFLVKECSISMGRLATLPFRDYVSANYSFDVEILDAGSTPVEIGCYFFPFESYLDFRVEETLLVGDSKKITLEIPISAMKSELSDFWCISGNLIINIQTTSTALIRFSSLLGKAQSDSPLSELILDMATLNGDSIDQALSLFQRHAPAVNLTRNDGLNLSGLLFSSRPNLSIYIKPGNYSSISGLYGWFSGLKNETQSYFELALDNRITLKCRIPIIRISLSITPPSIIDSLFVSWDQENSDFDHSIYISSLVPPYPKYLYVPAPNNSLRVYASYVTGFLGSWVGHSFSTEINTLGSSDIRLIITLPFFSIAGINLTSGELFVIIFLVGLIFGTLLQNERLSTPKSRAHILHDSRFYAVLLLVPSIILPWFSYTTIFDEAHLSLFVAIERIDIMLPLSIMIRSSQGVSGYPIYENYIWLESPTLFFLFWRPLRSAILRIGRTNRGNFDLWFLLCILSPFLIGLCYLLIIPYQLSIQTGMICAAASPTLYCISVLIQRYRKRNTV